MKRLKQILLAATITLGLGALVVAPYEVSAVNLFEETCSGPNSSNEICSSADDNAEANTLMRSIIQTLIFLIAAIAVIMIVIGGFKYVTSNGDTNQTTSAKNTILYSVIGLIVAIMAYGIVEFVIVALE